jgi:hypothetical protein
VIDLKPVKALGMNMLDKLLAIADKVIEKDDVSARSLLFFGLSATSCRLRVARGCLRSQCETVLACSVCCRHIKMIQVRHTGGDEFEVVVREGLGETHHHATMTQEIHQRLTSGRQTPERCIEAAFHFLLDRESKESILRRFDITIISRYFPEFERQLPRYLSQL